MEKRMNKKAQDLSIGTLILIVLGVIVLVMLIFGFNIGWQNLWEKINIFGGGSSIGDVVIACKLAVTSQDKYGYFQSFKQIKIDGTKEYVNCQDGRVEASLDDKLSGAPAGYEDKDKSSKTYCTSLAVNKKPANINGMVCPEPTGPVAPAS